MGMRYATAVVEEEGCLKVEQVFFHDPDGYMVELCNCDNIPIVPLSSINNCAFKPKATNYNNHHIAFTTNNAPLYSCGFMENVMMESLSMDMLNFSF